jgi:hypothetical protein
VQGIVIGEIRFVRANHIIPYQHVAVTAALSTAVIETARSANREAPGVACV